MIQTRIRRKVKCRNLGCLYESVSFNKIPSHTWDKYSLAQNFSFKCQISSCTKRLICRAFGDIKSKHCWSFQQHKKYFNTQQAAADETELLVTNADIQEDLQEDDFSRALWEDLQEETNGLDIDESSVNHFDLIANFLLELREKYNVSTSATCFISEKLGRIVEQDRNMFANKILKVLHKDENFVQSYESRMTVHMVSPFVKACRKFTEQESLSTYIKAKKCFVEPKELQVGSNPETGKADSVQYIPIFETLKILLSKEHIVIYQIQHRNTVAANFNLSSDDTLKSFQNGKAFYENSYLNSNKKAVELILYDFNVVSPLGNKTVKYKTFYFVFGKLPSKFKSKLSEINLVFLASAHIISGYGYQKILQPVLDDIKELETKGVEVTFERLNHIFL